VLIDFERSVFERSSYDDSDGSVVQRSHGGIRARIFRFVTGGNMVATAKCREMLDRIKQSVPRPTVLIIGGGSIGMGTQALYADPAVQIIGTDVYASPNTQLVADGHHLPLKNETFDAVWIQAVLEHVLEPQVVVDEIHRVLKADGLVYADTPFMQQVHEGAYDFTRFTQNGHRWLFRKFLQIDAGVVGGPGVSTIWSIRYLARALGAGHTLSSLIALPFFWLRFLDRFSKPRLSADAANATYFFGVKSNVSLGPKEIARCYEEQT
jgi:hypothetical protein